MAIWKMKKQECEGTYMFQGHLFVSAEIQADIPREEIIEIIETTQSIAKEKGGLDYLQVFENEHEEKLYFIASANQDMLESGNFDPDDMEYNNCVLCYPHER